MAEDAQHPRKKLLEQVREILRMLESAKRQEEPPPHPLQRGNMDWIRRFILFHDTRHPREMGVAEVKAFLTYLAAVGLALTGYILILL